MSRVKYRMMQFFSSALLLLLAGGIWFVFVRPVPRHWAQGVIVSKSYKPPGVYTQYEPGDRQGFCQPTRIPIAEGFVVEIDIDDAQGSVISLLNTVEATRYEVGSRVAFEYEQRGIPLLWKRV